MKVNKPVGMSQGFFLLILTFLLFQSLISNDHTFIEIDRLPRIDPDYTDVVIPPNIAPLNFLISEPGVEYKVEITSEEGSPIRLQSDKAKVILPLKKWKALLQSNPGQDLNIQITVKDSTGQWMQYKPIQNTIASDKIDSYVAYRLINPGYVLWWDMGIYQRNIETFEESAIMTNRVTNNNCMNCHEFCQNDPEKMMFHMRAAFGGTMFIQDGEISKVNTGTDYTMSAGVYPSWHPDGNHVAFSVNKIYQSFHSVEDKSIHVWDSASDLVVYDVQNKMITTSPKVSTKRMENLPTWSADGKTLYFISGDVPETGKKLDSYHYNLMRIPYNVTTNEWGEVEMVIDATKIGKSISWPKPSPDGKTLLFTMSDYGYFSIHFKSSDLYLLDLGTKHFTRLDAVNSPHSDSYHSWSSNSRWFVFASKRKDGLCSRLYFSYVDSNGKAYKPVLLPQKDPAFYDTFIKNYNKPEMIKGPVKVNHADLIKMAHQDPEPVRFDPAVDVDALSSATRMVREPADVDDLDALALPYAADGR
ncbi:PD40 domain-containing protein [candidate division KSB1 bacterium]|nr:PD40 domain-containing protein [candidate division KSB1 bacterium]